MDHDNGRPAVADPVIARLIAVSAAQLARRHPGMDAAAVRGVVNHAAVELVGLLPDTERFLLLLDRRADARLRAQSGHPVPITSARAGTG
jgi:hypothetical protein